MNIFLSLYVKTEKVEDVADEYDSNVSTTDSEGDSDDSAAREKKKKKKEKKEKKKTHREKSASSSVSFGNQTKYSLQQMARVIIDFVHEKIAVKIQKEEEQR